MSYIHVTEDEMDKKKRELREKMAQVQRDGGNAYAVSEFDRFAIKNAKPGMYYRGVKHDPKGLGVASAQAKGLVMVTEKDEEDWVLGQKSPTGGKLNGDVVLMKMPRERHIERRALIELKREQAETGYMAAKRDAINRIARNDLRGKPHVDHSIDTSVEGPVQTATIVKPKVTT